MFDLTANYETTPQPDDYPAMEKAIRALPSLAGVNLGMVSLVGSHGYGLAHGLSDLDFKGFYLTEPTDFWGLKKPQDQYECDDPDLCVYELSKFARLAANANPNVLEILWANPVVNTPAGEKLQAIRHAFLSNKVRKTYGGYAQGQFNMALNGKRDALYEKRRPKALRHLFRLYEQGMEILTTGDLTYALADPERIRTLGNLTDDDAVREAYTQLDEKFKDAVSILPDEPDYALIESTLQEIRRDQFNQ